MDESTQTIQVSDSGALEAICQKEIDANPNQAAAYRAGKTSINRNDCTGSNELGQAATEGDNK